MRLFATGAMSWVMGRALPDDVPIEAKMVTKAIERAQNTVEGRNAEIRKDVLKYDEVMNEQRKVIYARRLQVIDGEDLREPTESSSSRRSTAGRRTTCPSELPRGVGPRPACRRGARSTTRRSSRSRTSTRPTSAGQITESLLARRSSTTRTADQHAPRAASEDRPAQIERDVMLQIIDQRWRDHLAEMDYLREGIHLRAMGQQDPLVAWQREGFEMFGQLMEAIDDDYLRYVIHVQVVVEPAAEPDLAQAELRGRRRPRGRARLLGAAAAADRPTDGAAVEPTHGPDGGAGGGRHGPAGPASGPAPPGRRGDPRADGQGAHREARAQRAVLVRERQEVQALPWRGLSRRAGGEHRDLAGELDGAAATG